MQSVQSLRALTSPSRAFLALACMLGCLALAAPAEAAWPGKDGAIVFERRGPGDIGIWIEQPSGKQRKLTTSQEASEAEPTFSPSGRSVAYVRSYGSPGIWLMNSHGTGKRKVASGSFSDPAFFPNGRRILFTYRSRVFTTRIDGPGPATVDVKELTPLAGEARDPAVSPNGRWLVYTSTRAGDKHTLVLQDLSSGQLHRLPSGFSSEPDFSPDGKQIVFESRQLCGSKRVSRRAISTIGLRDKRVRRLVSPCEKTWAPSDPVWSPSGRRIIFTRDRVGSGPGLQLMTADGTFLSGAPQYVAAHSEDRAPSWQPLP